MKKLPPINLKRALNAEMIDINSGPPLQSASTHNVTLRKPAIQLLFREGYRYTEIKDLRVAHFSDTNDYVFFEPKPTGQMDDSNLEGCLRYASKVEQLIDKNNLY